MCFSINPSRCMAWRCHDCFGDPVFCTHCIQQSHLVSPFHRVSGWDGKCFSPSSLSNAGLTLNLGHGGQLCPSYTHSETRNPLQNRSEVSMTTKALHESTDRGRLSPEGTGGMAEVMESPATTRKRTLSIIDMHTEACDPNISVHYDNHFWESLPSELRRQVSASSPTPTPIQPYVHTTIIPNTDTSQDPFFAKDSEEKNDWKNPDKGNVPLRVRRDNKKYDDLQCPILTVVDTTGIHELRTRFCRCRPLASNPLHTQLLNMGLYPSSVERTRTVFTFRLLHHYDLTNLEGKTSAWQYYSTLRRLSSNVFPDIVVDRYRELMRALRQWRDLTSRRRAGLPMDKEIRLGPGGLALFCPACPQPGVNLPANWKDDAEQYVPSSLQFEQSFSCYSRLQMEVHTYPSRRRKF